MLGSERTAMEASCATARNKAAACIRRNGPKRQPEADKPGRFVIAAILVRLAILAQASRK